MSKIPILQYTPKQPYFGMPDAGTGASPESPIRVNSLGRFYTDRYTWAPVGFYPPASYGARAVILLHELAHHILPPGFTSDDAFTNGASESNTQLVVDHCAAAINAQNE